MPATLETDEAVVREAEWADIHVGFETYNEYFDLAPLLKGLPDDMYQCPHYGYVLKGRMRVNYADREEEIKAGDAYYLTRGYIPVVEAGTEIVEFSPRTSIRGLWRLPSVTSPRYRRITKASGFTKRKGDRGAMPTSENSARAEFADLPFHTLLG